VNLRLNTSDLFLPQRADPLFLFVPYLLGFLPIPPAISGEFLYAIVPFSAALL